MAFKITWSPQAEKSFDTILNYLSENWTQKQMENLILRTESAMLLIAKNPFIFRSSEKENIHEVLITKHNLLLYQVIKTEKRIELLAFFDTRQNPKKKFK